MDLAELESTIKRYEVEEKTRRVITSTKSGTYVYYSVIELSFFIQIVYYVDLRFRINNFKMSKI